ncbi:peptidyl-prolyl cis-trans isomerase [bacterium]|nr:peptidyl-prolyl cis-trans isomerase [bacterium]
MKQNNNPLIFSLILILFVIQLSQIFHLPFLPSNSQALSQKDKDAIISQMEDKLPLLVQKEISFQIHELVMDKIKLNSKIDEAKNKLVIQTVASNSILKIGSSIINKELFESKLKSFSSKAENKSKAKVDLKKSLITELHKHYAVIEACKREDIQKSPAFLNKLKAFKKKVFLSELIRNNVKAISHQDVENYYKKNISLYETGESYSFYALESTNRYQLMKVSSTELFDQNTLKKTNYQHQKDSTIPYAFIRSLNTLSINELSPVLRYKNLFYILKKTANQKKFYTPFQDVLPFIQKQLTHSRIRDFLQKTSNPIRFKHRVDKTKDSYTIDQKKIDQNNLKIAQEILPPAFFTPIVQIAEEKSLLNLQLDLIFKELFDHPETFGAFIVRQTFLKTKDYQEILMIQSKRDSLFAQVKVSEAEMKDFYRKNPKRFIQTKGELSSHIFIKNRSKALEILNLALMDPKNFSQLAKQHSEDQRSSKQGGDMRYLDKKQITPEMNTAVKTLSEGEVYAKLIEGISPKGFHILKFEKTMATKVVAYEEVKVKLNQWIIERKQAVSFSEFIAEALKKYPLQIDDSELAKI